MVGGRPEDVIFTSGGTEVRVLLCEEGGVERRCAFSRRSLFSLCSSPQANNMVIHTALRHFQESKGQDGATPHIVTSSVEHDSIRLPLEHLVKESLAGELGAGTGTARGRSCTCGPRLRFAAWKAGDLPYWQFCYAKGEKQTKTGTCLLCDVPLFPPQMALIPEMCPCSHRLYVSPGWHLMLVPSGCMPAAHVALLPFQ